MLLLPCTKMESVPVPPLKVMPPAGMGLPVERSTVSVSSPPPPLMVMPPVMELKKHLVGAGSGIGKQFGGVADLQIVLTADVYFFQGQVVVLGAVGVRNG